MKRSGTIGLLLVCAFATSLRAQDAPPAEDPPSAAEAPSAGASSGEEPPIPETGEPQPEQPKGPPQELRLSLTGWQRVEARARLDDGPAALSVYRSSFQAQASRFFGLFARGSVGASYEWSRYDLHQARDVDPPRPPTAKDPWDRLHVASVRLEGQLFLSRKFYLSAFVSGRLGFEEGTELERSFTVAAFFLAGWRITEDFELLFGAGGVTQLEDSPTAFPALGVRWKITDWLRVDLLGPQLRFTATPHEGLELTFRVAWQNRQYRFAKRRSLFAEHILQDSLVEVVAGLSWFPTEVFGIRAELGVIAYRELELFDPDGDDVYRLQGGDPGVLAALGLELRF